MVQTFVRKENNAKLCDNAFQICVQHKFITLYKLDVEICIYTNRTKERRRRNAFGGCQTEKQKRKDYGWQAMYE